MDPRGKKAIIVGGASGMARAAAELLVQAGASVAILDRPQSAGAEVAAGLGGTFHPCDVTDDAGTEAAIDAAVEALGGSLHISVNTAGGGIGTRTLSKDGPHPLDEFRDDHRAEPDQQRSTSPDSRPSTWRATSPRTTSAA